jgi:hypothetical protein
VRAAAAGVAASLMVVASAASATTEPVGTAVVTPNPSYQGTAVDGLSADPTGVTYAARTPGKGPYVAYHRAFSGQSPVTLASQSSPFTAWVVNGVAAVPQIDSTSGQITSVSLTPLSGGSSSSVSINTLSGESPLGSTGSGVIVRHDLSTGDFGTDLLLRRPGLADVTLDHLPNDSGPHGLVDQSGMALLESSGITLRYYNFSANTQTTLNTDPNDLVPWLRFMTPSLVGWLGGSDHRTMVWVSRSGGAQHRVTVPFTGVSVYGFAVSGSTLAWTTYSNFRYVLYEEPADGSGSATEIMSSLAQPDVITTADGNFAVVARPAPSTFGIYAVTPQGQSSLLQTVGSDWAVTFQAALSADRLTFSDTSTQSPSTYALPFTLQSGSVTLGTETPLGTGIAGNSYNTGLVSSDARAAYATGGGSGPIVVYNGSMLQRTINSTTNAGASQLSGDHLLYWANGSLQIMDLATGVSSPGPSSPELWGHYLYYQGAPGQILRRDYNKSLSLTNPIQVRAADGFGVVALYAVWGNWMMLTQSSQSAGYARELWNMKTGVKLALTVDQLNSGRLGDGVLVYVGVDAQSNPMVEAMDLTKAGHPITAIGDLPNIYPGQVYAVDTGGGQSVAWVHPDGRIHIAPLNIPASYTSLFDRQTPHSVVAASQWVAAWDMSKPVSWTLTIKNSSAVIVRTITGTAPNASIRLTWNKRNDANTTLPAGTYSWTLSATGLDGRGTVKQTGSVVLK